MRSHEVDTVFHLGGMLSVPSEQDPWSAFEVNIHGTYRLLEAARLSGVKQSCWPAASRSMARTSPTARLPRPPWSTPASMYGVCKIFGEQMGKHYQRRFGLDFRALRLSSVVGPGSKVAHMSIYNCWAIEKPLLGRPYQILVEPQTRCPVIYYRGRGPGHVAAIPSARKRDQDQGLQRQRGPPALFGRGTGRTGAWGRAPAPSSASRRMPGSTA